MDLAGVQVEIGVVPEKISRILEEFKDVMPPKLPKKLSPHKIELIVETKTLSRTPFRLHYKKKQFFCARYYEHSAPHVLPNMLAKAFYKQCGH